MGWDGRVGSGWLGWQGEENRVVGGRVKSVDELVTGLMYLLEGQNSGLLKPFTDPPSRVLTYTS